MFQRYPYHIIKECALSRLLSLFRNKLPLFFLPAALLAAADSPFLPVSAIKAGMHGIGKTVFSGDRIEDFDVTILGVLENVGPKQSLILARLSGGPLDHTGIMQGMSGSPVYIDGKLIGAIALGFPFSKDPIGAIRPIEEMIAAAQAPRPPARPGAIESGNLLAALKRPALENGMTEIATPIGFGGFTAGTLAHFAPQLRALGLEPRQGFGTGGRPTDRMGDPSALHPGSMISVELMSGDLTVGADGTVTYIDGSRVYAFGHRFLDVGPTGIPFARSEVLALLPNLNSSFKISSPKEMMGVISQDRNTAIAGELGGRAALLPLTISIARSGKPAETYRMQMVNDAYLAPILTQMAVFSAIDGSERTAGESTLAVNSRIELDGRAPVVLRNVYSGQGALALQASLGPSIPLAYIAQSGFNDLRIKALEVSIDSVDLHKELTIDDVSLSRREAHPGDTVELVTRLSGDNGFELLRPVRYRIPIGAPQGTLFFSVADGPQTSLAELRASFGANVRSSDQLLSAVARLRANDKAYVRVWRGDPSFQVGGEDLPDPPPSVALALSASTANQQVRNSKLAEFEFDGAGMMVTGSKTVQLEVKP